MKIIRHNNTSDAAFARLMAAVESGPAAIVTRMAAAKAKKRALMLPYKSGDRCLRCGNGGFNVGRTVATCSNPRCELPVPLG